MSRSGSNNTIRLIWLIAGVVACGSPARPGPAPHVDDLEQLAKELDPGSVTPVWSALPAPMRAALEADVTATSDSARLALARERLSKELRFTSEDPVRAGEQVALLLQALFLLEPLAFGNTPDEHAADVLLARVWMWAGWFGDLSLVVASDPRQARDPRFDPRALRALAEQSERMQRAFAVRVLRRGGFDKDTRETLAGLSTRARMTEDFTRERRLWETIVARDPSSLGTWDWLSVATALLATEDFPGADVALAKARATLPPAGPGIVEEITRRRSEAAIRQTAQRRDTAYALTKAAAGTTLDAQIARGDRLAEMGRKREARRQYADALELGSNDARLLVRIARGELMDRWRTGEPPLSLVTELLPRLAPGTSNRDAEYWSLTLALRGIATSEAIIRSGTLPTDLAKVLGELRAVNASFETFDPARAAAITFALDRIVGVVDRFAAGGAKQDELVETIRAEAVAALPALRALITRFPDTADLFRLLYTFGMFVGDVDESFALVALAPSRILEDQPDLYLQQAIAAVMLAARSRDEQHIERARAIAEMVPASNTNEIEGTRAALLGDLDSLRAEASGDEALWRRAIERYAAAVDLVVPASRARIVNNRAYALARLKRGAEAIEAWRAAQALPSERPWISVLNSVLESTADRSARLQVLATIAQEKQNAGADTPGIVAAWQAMLTTDPAAAREAARRAVDAASSEARPAELYPNELEGSSTFGVTTRGRGHLLNTRVEAWLWLVQKPDATVDKLRALATPPTPPAPSKRRR